MSLKIAVPKKLTKSLKNSGEGRALFLVKLQATEDRISDPTYASPLAL